jgi:hypothetical protein
MTTASYFDAYENLAMTRDGNGALRGSAGRGTGTRSAGRGVI